MRRRESFAGRKKRPTRCASLSIENHQSARIPTLRRVILPRCTNNKRAMRSRPGKTIACVHYVVSASWPGRFLMAVGSSITGAAVVRWSSVCFLLHLHPRLLVVKHQLSLFRESAAMSVRHFPHAVHHYEDTHYLHSLVLGKPCATLHSTQPSDATFTASCLKTPTPSSATTVEQVLKAGESPSPDAQA